MQKRVDKKANMLWTVLVFLGVLTGIFAFALGAGERFWHAYLLSYVYFILLSLGGLFFVSIHHATGAGWSVLIRRLAESLTAYLPYAVVLTLPLLFGAFSLYDWLDPKEVAEDPLLQHKRPYLNMYFFFIRMALFLGGWLFFGFKLVSFSLKQDRDGDVGWSKKSVPYSVGFLFFFALSVSLFSVDLLMSLDAHWFSTIFGVYVFAGLFQSVFAVLILLSAGLRRFNLYAGSDVLSALPVDKKLLDSKGIAGILTENHLHDLGKFLFASVLFWAYIAFSQYMLIWYANLPEETTFFLPRSKGVWAGVSISLIVFKFIIPFLFLLPRGVKRNWGYMVGASVLVLLMQFVDLYWLIYPHLSKQWPVFGWVEVGVFLGFFAVFARSVWVFLQKHSPIPLKDPRVQESLSHKVTY